MASVPTIRVSVAWSARPRQVREWQLDLPVGATVMDSLRACGLAASTVPAARPGAALLGIWGRKAQPDQCLREGDRVEVYRALQVDPKVARRERFRRQGARATGLFATRRAGAKAGY